MRKRHRLAAMTAAAAAILLMSQIAPVQSNSATAATRIDREPKVDETFGRKPVLRRSNDLASRAAELAAKGNYAEARRLAEQSGNPAAINLIEWLYLKDTAETAGFERLAEFITKHPDWPRVPVFAQAAERSLFGHNYAAQKVVDYFRAREPETAEGMLAMARAKLATANREEARSWAARGWRMLESDAAAERRVLSEFGSLLGPDAHKGRLWAKIAAQETNAAIRVAKFLSRDHQEAANTAQLLIRNPSGAKKSIAHLSPAMRSEPAMQYALTHYYRKADRNKEAAQILLKMQVDHAKIYGPEEVWTERRLVARDLLGRGDKKSWPTAQKLAAEHGFSSGPNAVEGEFLAGWIALRYLKDPNTALKHFKKLEAITTSRTDRARCKYWLGRTYAVLGQPELSTAAFSEAAKHETVFYGQLAREALGLGELPIAVDEIKPSREVYSRVTNDELVQAFRILAGAGREGEMGLFLWPIAKRFKTEQEMSAAASIVWDSGGPFMTVRLAKAAGSYGVDIDFWGYPVRAMPAYAAMGPQIEKALVYGVTRQESEFNSQAGSHAGARGLMQLMPGTAKLISRQYKIKYNPKLLTDPEYNAKLGAAHLGDLVKEFRGSYILSLVAYNAGPRRSLEWMRRYGDPRAEGIDPVDWVESIPFTETRYYVQKVLQNTHVYRSRLAPGSMRGMTADLLRGSGKKIDVTHFAQKSTASCGTQAASMAALIAVCDLR
jgi:soluble lytic murein transglycosylase